jgi:mono/diheme cytochrome c family protein
MEGRWEEGFEEPWPIIGTPDVQGGLIRLKPDGTLNKFTSISGQELFLGNRLPAYGDLFIPEPVGRLVRRAKVKNIEGKIVLTNAYEQTEFLASTDPNFRPVLAATGPDGCLYIVDMYRGIIQEGNWVKEGSFLRPVVARKGLDKNVGKGRIYRVVHEQMEPDKQIRLLDKSSEELLEYLGHPNGWYRLTAQKLLVVRQDLSVIPALKDKANENESFFSYLFSDKDLGLQRLHALWTLDGLGATEKVLLKEKYNDEDQRVRRAAIRLSEKFLRQGDEEVFNALSALANDADKEVLIQLLLSLRSYTDKVGAQEIKDRILKANPNNEVMVVSAVEVPGEIEALRKEHARESDSRRDEIVRGYEIYEGLCVNCHGKKGEGIKDIAPPLAGSPRAMSEDPKIPVMIVMDGLSGKVDGKEYGVMAPMENNDDQWFADVLTYVRMHFGEADNISENDVKKVREQYKDRNQYWTIEELEKIAPNIKK